ncbi:hypothetical protein GCM10010399_94860 [Dactylosporangium fulvum]
MAREVATVNGFYRWAVGRGFVEHNPIVQRPARGRLGHPRGDRRSTRRRRRTTVIVMI